MPILIKKKISNQWFQLLLWDTEKEEQTQPKISKRKEIKIPKDITEIEKKSVTPEAGSLRWIK